ncbi:MAG: hypothetical protein M0007_08770, partial [Actinomycetota bacterium]|nr:hypothetical protein [Actinomycetota bacterium]
MDKTNECSSSVPRWSSENKQVFVTVLDIEQVFVIDCRHGERVFGQREGGTVVAVWAEEPVEPSGSFLGGRPGPRLRLVDGAGAAGHPVGALRGYGQGM